MKGVYDIGGSFTRLQISLEAGPEQQEGYGEHSAFSKKNVNLEWALRCFFFKLANEA